MEGLNRYASNLGMKSNLQLISIIILINLKEIILLVI